MTQARWSTPYRLRKANLYAPRGIVLGYFKGALLRSASPEHLMVVASTQSGKSGSVVIPNLLSWRESVIVHDPKTELAQVSAGWRGTFSRVVNLSPTSSVSGHFNVWDTVPLREEGEERAVQLLAEQLTDPSGRGMGRSDTALHFGRLARIAFTGLILYGLYTQRARSAAALHAMLTRTDFGTLIKRMTKYRHRVIQACGHVLEEVSGRDEMSGVKSSTLSALELYTDRQVARATDSSDFTLRDLRERSKPMTVYVSVPFNDRERLLPWTRLVLRQLLSHCTSKLEGWNWKMLGLIDEAPSLGQMTLLHEGLNYVAGYGVRLMLLTPSMEKIIATYGPHHNFLEGCKIKIAFGIADADTAELVSKQLGDKEVWKRRRTGRQGGRELVREPLLSRTGVLGLKKRQAVLMASTEKVIVQLAYYKHDPIWKARSLVC